MQRVHEVIYTVLLSRPPSDYTFPRVNDNFPIFRDNRAFFLVTTRVNVEPTQLDPRERNIGAFRDLVGSSWDARRRNESTRVKMRIPSLDAPPCTLVYYSRMH